MQDMGQRAAIARGGLVQARDSTPVRFYPIALFALTVAVFASGARLHAQETSEQQAAPVAPPELTLESAQARLEALKKSTELDEALKTKLIDVTARTVEALRAAADWAKKGQDFDRDREAAPAQLAAAREQLSKAPVEFDPAPLRSRPVGLLETALAEAEGKLATAQKALSELASEPRRRADRRTEIPSQIAAARARIEQAEAELAAPPPADEPPELTQARLGLAVAQKAAAEREIQSHEKELATYDRRAELLQARNDLQSREFAQLERETRAIREALNTARQRDAIEAAKRAQAEATKELLNEIPALARIANENVQLADERTGPTSPAANIDQVSDHLETVNARLERVRSEFKSTSDKVNAAGLNNTTGQLLRKKRNELPNLRELRRDIRSSDDEKIANIQLRVFDLQEQRAALADIEDEIAEIMNGSAGDDEEKQKEIEETARELFQARRDLLDALKRDYDLYFSQLIELDTNRRALIAETEKFLAYIDERVLWIRSARPLGPRDITDSFRALSWLGDYSHWTTLARLSGRHVMRHPVGLIASLLAFAGLFAARRSIRARLLAINEKAANPRTTSFRPTIEAILYTLLLACLWPLLVWYLGTTIGGFVEGTEFTASIGAGLRDIAALWLALALLEQIFRHNGLAEAHFDWPKHSFTLVRRSVRALRPVILPVAFLVGTLLAQSNDTYRTSLGRIGFLIAMGSLSLFAHRIFHPRKGFFRESVATGEQPWKQALIHLY